MTANVRRVRSPSCSTALRFPANDHAGLLGRMFLPLCTSTPCVLRPGRSFVHHARGSSAIRVSTALIGSLSGSESGGGASASSRCVGNVISHCAMAPAHSRPLIRTACGDSTIRCCGSSRERFFREAPAGGGSLKAATIPASPAMKPRRLVFMRSFPGRRSRRSAVRLAGCRTGSRARSAGTPREGRSASARR